MIIDIYMGFDFGYKRIGVAVGQKITGKAQSLAIIIAKNGVPSWIMIEKLISQWRPQALIVGLPKCINDKEQYTTHASRLFSEQLAKHFKLPVYLVDERLTTVEARSQLFSQGGYKKIKKTAVDSIAACIILEQWMSCEAEL